MSDSPTDTVGVPRDLGSDLSLRDLAHHLHDVVLGTPGVATLVPTMSSALGRLHRRPRPEERGRDSSADGVSLTSGEDAVTVVIDITVASTVSVLDTALAVRSAAVTLLESTHAGTHTVRVNVLGLEVGRTDEP
jgi:hypothetical protein